MNFHQLRAMRCDVELEFAGKLADVFLTPKIADKMLARQLEVGPVGTDRGVSFAKVEETDGSGAVFEVFGIDAEVTVF